MENPPEPPSNKDRQPNAFLQYSGLGFQMLATIGAGVWLGTWLDGQQANKTPVWTLVLALVSIGVSIYLLIRGMPGEPPRKQS